MTNQVHAPWDPAAPVDPEAPKSEKLEKLRAKFPRASIGKLPRATSKDARPGKCSECGGWHKLPAIHLDYVGHAEVTDRLLSVDPEWDWCPLSFTEDGMPRFILSDGYPVGLWIKLTVCGVTRLGFGSVERGAFDAEKQLIGDALRNAAMRFGVALDLWSKNELESNIEEAPQTDASASSQSMRDDPVWDRRTENAPGVGKSPPSDAAHVSSKNEPRTERSIRGVPITILETWRDIRPHQIKGKGPYAKLTWAEVDTQPDPSPFMDWLEKGVAEIMLDHKRALDAGKKNVPLPAAQRALLAWQRLLDRRAGLTEDENDGTVPLTDAPMTEDEMADADRKYDERAGR